MGRVEEEVEGWIKGVWVMERVEELGRNPSADPGARGERQSGRHDGRAMEVLEYREGIMT